MPVADALSIMKVPVDQATIEFHFKDVGDRQQTIFMEGFASRQMALHTTEPGTSLGEIELAFDLV